MISHTPQPPPLPPGGTYDPLQVHFSGPHASHFPENVTLPQQPAIIVRAEEALIVVLVLVLWVAAIALFFNRWGKIRMLEPYQPKFIQQHRPSCPLGDSVQHRSFSKFNISHDFQLMNPQHLMRPRQNSVFVGSSMVTLPMNPPRKVKSAFDLKNLVFSDPALNKSIIRLNFGRDEFRRSSMLPAFERAQCYEEPKKADSRHNSISSIRRGSILPESCKNVLSVECERTLLPQPAIKSGVLDFRRNSMLIINNLTEDVGPSVFPRNLSLGGSNLNLAPDFPAPRRNSVIPPYIIPPKHKPKCLSVTNSVDKYITNQKGSKSLDSEACHIIKRPPTLRSEIRQQLLQPITQKRSSLSSEALTIKEPEFPSIIETHCSSPVSSTDEFIYKCKTDECRSSQAKLLANDELYYGANSCGVGMTVSLTDLNASAVSNAIAAQSTDQCFLSGYKVTNV